MTKTILLVDDTESMRNLVRDCFIRAGYRVVTAVNGLQALTTVRAYGRNNNRNATT